MKESPVAQASGDQNNIVEVYGDRVELHSGWQNQRTETLSLRDISHVSIKGWVNCTMTIQTNKGRQHQISRMALPEAREVKTAIESRKLKAGLYE